MCPCGLREAPSRRAPPRRWRDRRWNSPEAMEQAVAMGREAGSQGGKAGTAKAEVPAAEEWAAAVTVAAVGAAARRGRAAATGRQTFAMQLLRLVEGRWSRRGGGAA